MNFKKTILPMLICFSLILTSFGTAFAEETQQELPTDEQGTYLIGTADELFAFADIVKTTAEADKAAGAARTSIHAKLTANIDLNSGATFTYDHETGLVTVAKGNESYKMGSGMKDTELGNFHPVYNGLCTLEQWNNKNLTEERLKEYRDKLIEEMNAKVEALGLKKWTPIGTVYPYVGTFDGNGHTIDGLYINDNTVGYTGLFGKFSDVSGSHADGELQNLTIGENSLIVGYESGKAGATGAFVGNVGFGTVSGCTNYATVVGKGYYYSWIYDSTTHGYDVYGQVGGIAGLSFGKIQNCVNRGTIVSLESAAGIAGNVLGYDNRDTSVTFSTNYGNVYSGTEENYIGRAGGIAVNVGCIGGDIQFLDPVEACTNFGYVEGGYAGGIVQTSANGAANESILYCANRGEISGSISASGIVDYIYNYTGSFVMKGCYNAGVVSMLSDNTTRKAYPIASIIHTYSTTGGVYAHTIENCYNDKTVCPAEDNELFGTYITSTDCFSVPTELFATGEPAYKMGSFDNKGWKQNISTPAEDGKTPEIYPTTNGTRRVYENTHYCCHTEKTHKKVFYSNAYGNITDEHNPDDNGICEHCGMDTRKPIFLLDTLPEAKAGKRYSVTIRLNNDVPMVNDYIKATVSDTDDTTYTFSHGLTGTADFSFYNKYYYYISGIPTEAGELTFTLSASNYNGTTKKTYTLKINEADPLEIDTDTKLNNGTVGESYWRTLLCYSTDLEKTWSVANGSELPAGLTLSEDGTISGEPTQAGDYSFTIVLTVGNQTAEKTFTLKVFEEGGCKHDDKTEFAETPATCLKNGIKYSFHCNICEKDFDENGNEIYNKDILKTFSNHFDKNDDGKCDFCGKNMPIFKKVKNQSEIVYGGTYVYVTKIDNKYYALALPPEGKYEREYTDYMNLCEVIPNASGDFTFKELADNDAMMIKNEFAAENGQLDAGSPRYGFSTVFDDIQYGLADYGSNCFYISANEPAKYGYRIMVDAQSGAVSIGSVEQAWWSSEKTENNGILRAYDMNYNGTNKKLMTFHDKDEYIGEYGPYTGAEMTEYPIYLYRMTDIGTAAGGITFVSNDANSTVDRGSLVQEVELSNVRGIANAVTQDALAAAISEFANGEENVSVQIYADIQGTDFKTDEKDSQSVISVTYSVTPRIAVTDSNGTVLGRKTLADSDLNGTPITVTLCTGGMRPEQIIHYKEDGTKEFFYAAQSDKVKNGAKSFECETDNNGATDFVTFEITDFSEIKILANAEPEQDTQNNLNYDGKTITATVDKDDSYTVIFAGYGGRRLIYIKTSVQKLNRGENIIEIPSEVDISKVNKIFLWKNLSAMQPMCEPREIN